MPEAQDKAKDKPESNKLGLQYKDGVVEVVKETPEYKEFKTLNGAIRRDMK